MLFLLNVTFGCLAVWLDNKYKMVLLIKAKPRTTSLEDTNLVGNVHSLRISSKAHESLLGAEGGDDGVHLLGLHAVELIHGVADLLLVGTEVDEEGKDVLLLQH